jgi:hypothetical protein
VSSKLAHFPREIGHKSQGGIFCLGCCCIIFWDRPYCIGRTAANFGTEIEAREDMFFEAVLEEISEGGHSFRKKVRQPIVGTNFEVLFSANLYYFQQGSFVVRQFFAISCLSWLENVLWLLINIS